MPLSVSSIFDTGKRAVKDAMDDDVTGLASELAYRFLLALFPFFIFIAALGGFVAGWFGIQNPTQEIMDQLEGRLPQDATSVIQGQLESVVEQQNPGLLSIGFVAAIWAASTAMNTIIKAFNRAYDVEESRPFYSKIPLAVGLTLLAGVAFIAGFAIIIAGQLYAEEIGALVGLEGTAVTVANAARFLVVGVMIMVAMAFLYWAAPNIDIPFRWVTPGAVFFVIAWLVATVLFSIYVQNFGSYNETYGSLGGVIMLMVWFYITGLIMLIGAEINALTQAVVVPGELSGPVAEDGIVGEKRREAGAAGSGQKSDARDWESRPPQREIPRRPAGTPTLALGGLLGAVAVWRILTDGRAARGSGEAWRGEGEHVRSR